MKLEYAKLFDKSDCVALGGPVINAYNKARERAAKELLKRNGCNAAKNNLEAIKALLDSYCLRCLRIYPHPAEKRNGVDYLLLNAEGLVIDSESVDMEIDLKAGKIRATLTTGKLIGQVISTSGTATRSMKAGTLIMEGDIIYE